MNKILKLAGLMGFLALVGASQANAQAACFYEHDDYQGRSYCIDANQSIDDFQNLGFNDTVSSIRIAPGYTVTACVDHYFQGNCTQFSGDVRSLSNYRLNDTISSARVTYNGGGYPQPGPGYPGPGYPQPEPRPQPGYPQPGYPQPGNPGRGGQACFYNDAGFSGAAFCLQSGQTNTALGGTGFNDTISSITVTPGTSVLVCEHKDFGGRCLRINRNVRNLSNFNFNDLISSIQVQ